MLPFLLKPELVRRSNEVELTKYIRTKDGKTSILALKGADRPDLLRGPNPFGLIFDEYATMKPEAWEVIQPVLRANNGWAWFTGTPKGRNHFYDLYLRGKQEDKEWKSWFLPASESGIIAKEQLEIARASMPERVYQQELECAFHEAAGIVFRGVPDICTLTPSEPIIGHHYVMGVDLAKHEDFTVIAVYDRGNNFQVYQDRFNKIEWPFQKKRIQAVCEKYNHASVVVDATGIGDPIVDDLGREGLPIIPFKITEPSKKELIEKLSIFIEQQNIRMLDLTETVDEFANFGYKMLQSGRVSYGAERGAHDDIVIAHALAISELGRTVIKAPTRERSLVGQFYDKLTKQNQREAEGDYEIPNEFF